MNKYNHHNKGNSNDKDNKNLILAIVFSVIILTAFHYFYERPRLQQLRQSQMLEQQEALATDKAADKTEVTIKEHKEDSFATKRVDIDTASLKGSLALTGARFDNLLLKNYTITEDSTDEVSLLASTDSAHPYYGHFGWLSGTQGIAVPDLKTQWSANSDKLGSDKPLHMTWQNGQGFVFSQEVSVDDKYLFTIKKKIKNTTNKEATFYPYGLISREGLPEDYQKIFILHEGPMGYIDNSLVELNYDDVKDDGVITYKEPGQGWLGITDKYWLTALMPEATGTKEMRFVHSKKGTADKYQTDYKGEAIVVAPGETIETTVYFFAGAKELKVLDRYEDELGFKHLDLSIDFGWFYFITKPFFYIISFLYSLVGNFGLAIIVFTIILRLALFPLSNKGFKSMARMKKLTPKLEELKEKHKNDRARLQQEILAMYQKENVNPLSGCFPILIQIPIFFALYKVLYVSIEMRHAPFWGWITDLSQPDPTNVFNLFGLIPIDLPSFLHIGVWPLIMCATLVIQQRLNPKISDPVQQKMMTFFPFFMTYILARFPAGLVIYWSFSNLFSVAQQWYITRRINAEDKKAAQ